MIEVYASLEIQKKEMYFVVSRIRNGRANVIFKDKIKGEWLDDEDVVIDLNITSAKLNKIIQKFEKEFNLKLKYLILILPSGTLQIESVDENLNLNPTIPIDHESLQEVYKNLQNKHKLMNYENILIRPYRFKISNAAPTNNPPIGMKSPYLLTDAKIYSIMSDVVSSHHEVVKKTNRDVILKTIDMFATGKGTVASQKFKNTFVLVNWGESKIKVGFYSQEALGDLVVINKGTKDLIKNISKKLNIKPRDVEKYMFKLINFSKKALINSDLILRKYDSEKYICQSYTSEDVRKIIIEEIKKFLFEIQSVIKNTIKVNPEVYYLGKITEMAGFTDIISETEFSKTSFLFYSSALAAKELWVTSSLGAISIQRLFNKQNAGINKNSLEIVKLFKNFEPNNEQAMNHNNKIHNLDFPNRLENNHLQQRGGASPNQGYNRMVPRNNYNNLNAQANYYSQQAQKNSLQNQAHPNYINPNQNVQNYRDFQHNGYFSNNLNQYNQQNNSISEQNQYLNYKNNNNF